MPTLALNWSAPAGERKTAFWGPQYGKKKSSPTSAWIFSKGRTPMVKPTLMG